MFHFPQAIKKGLVYVVRYEIYDDLLLVPDIMDSRPTRHMLPPSSPIGLFAVRLPKGKEEKPKLRPVAIQMDYKPGEKLIKLFIPPECARDVSSNYKGYVITKTKLLVNVT